MRIFVCISMNEYRLYKMRKKAVTAKLPLIKNSGHITTLFTYQIFPYREKKRLITRKNRPFLTIVDTSE